MRKEETSKQATLIDLSDIQPLVPESLSLEVEASKSIEMPNMDEK